MLDIYQVLMIVHTVKLNMMSQVQQAQHFKMAAKSPKWLQEITSKQPDTQK